MGPRFSAAVGTATIAVLAGAPLLAAGEQCGPHTPSYLEAGDFAFEGPVWVAAEALTAHDGEVDWSVAGPWLTGLVEGRDVDRRVPPLDTSGFVALSEMRAGTLVVEQADGWKVRRDSGRAALPGAPKAPDPGLREAVLEASAVVVASVVETCPGFLLDDVGALVTLRSEEVLFEGDGYALDETVHLFWPSVELELGGYRFTRTKGGVRGELAAGERLLVVAAGPPLDASGRFLLPTVLGVVRESDGGGISGPPEGLPEGVSTFDGAVTAARVVLSGRGQVGRAGGNGAEASGPRREAETRRAPALGLRSSEATWRPEERVFRLRETVTGTLELRGWALHAENGVGRVVAWLDGEPVYGLETGLPEPGVCERIPDPSCPDVGFSLVIDTSELADGVHTVTIVAVENVASKPMPGFLKVVFRSQK